MSQFPSPYQPPYPTPLPQGMPPSANPFLSPARRAGVLMIVIGCLAMLFGVCNGLSSWFLPAAQMEAQLRNLRASSPGVSVDMVRVLGVVMSALILLLGLFYLIMGIVVRKGSKAAVVIAMIGVVIGILSLGLLMLAGLFSGLNAGTIIALCLMAVPGTLLVLVFIWLIQSLRAADAMQANMLQYHQQYLQYQYTLQQYNQGGYTYSQPTPPPPPAPSDLNSDRPKE